MGCARCHDHMGDPIPQRDYYRMLAFFRGIAPYKIGGGNATTPANYVDRIPENLGSPDAHARLTAWERQRALLIADVKSIVAQAAGCYQAIALRTLAGAITSQTVGRAAHALLRTRAQVRLDEHTTTLGNAS